MELMGDERIQIAETYENSWNFIDVIYSDSKKEKLVNEYKTAGNMFKASKSWKKCAEAYIKAATLSSGNGYSFIYNREAVEAYGKNGDIEIAQSILADILVPYYIKNDRFKDIGELYMTLAKNSEDYLHDTKALELYILSATNYGYNQTAPNYESLAKEKAAYLYTTVHPPKYDEAIELFDSIGHQKLNQNLTKYNAATFFFNTILCILAKGDVVSAKIRFELYLNTDSNFNNQSYEKTLLLNIITAIENSNNEAFKTSLQIYTLNSRKSFNPWTTKMLDTIKDTIQ